MPQRTIATRLQAYQQCAHPAHAQPQLRRCLLLRDVPFLDFVQDLERIPLLCRHPQLLASAMLYKNGTSYFAERGTSHVAATEKALALTQDSLRVDLGRFSVPSRPSLRIGSTEPDRRSPTLDEVQHEIQHIDVHYRNRLIYCAGDAGSTGRAAYSIQPCTKEIRKARLGLQPGRRIPCKQGRSHVLCVDRLCCQEQEW